MLQIPKPNFIKKFLHLFSNKTSDVRRHFRLATLARAVFHIIMIALLSYISVQFAQKTAHNQPDGQQVQWFQYFLFLVVGYFALAHLLLVITELVGDISRHNRAVKRFTNQLEEPGDMFEWSGDERDEARRLRENKSVLQQAVIAHLSKILVSILILGLCIYFLVNIQTIPML